MQKTDKHQKINYKEKINKVLKHPTWKMGTKITIDSSTFANKILELFEAKILFISKILYFASKAKSVSG